MKFLLVASIIFSLCVLPIYAQEGSGISIYKDVSTIKSQWGDRIDIKITLTNSDSNSKTNLQLIDEINPIFSVKEHEDLLTQKGNTLSANIENIGSGETKIISYSIESKKGLNSQKSMEFVIPKAKISYVVNGNEFLKSSNEETITLNPWWEQNLIGVTIVLLILTFVTGTIGTGIHNLNIKRENEYSSKKDKSTPHPLLGGVAGLLVLGMFEGLSVLFSDGQLQPTVQNMVVLIGTCLAAGFAPMEIINRATKQWKAEADKQKAENIASKSVMSTQAKTQQDSAERLEDLINLLEKAKTEGVQ